MQMLVLTRKLEESIIIDGNIEVSIIGITKHQVRIGVKAPKDVSVNRKEIQSRIDAEKEQLKQ